MLESVANLKKAANKSVTVESGAFQQLFLLVGMHFFKVQRTISLLVEADSSLNILKKGYSIMTEK